MQSAPQIKIRLPPQMRDRIRVGAQINHRSVNSQIVHLLDRALAVEAERSEETVCSSTSKN